MLSTFNKLHGVSIFNDRINMVDLFRGKERATEHLIRLDASFPIRHGIRQSTRYKTPVRYSKSDRFKRWQSNEETEDVL